MTSSQQHGFAVEEKLAAEFERYVAHHGIRPPHASPEYTARFDVGAHRDPYGQGLPSSIKTAKYIGPRTLVCLSDAVRIASLTEVPRMRLLVALYRQEKDRKVFSEMREYLIEGDEWSKLMGEVPIDHVEAFSNAIKAPGVHTQARAVAKQWRERLAQDYPGAMRWNAKIDSKRQRRLQCSVRLEDIEAVIANKSRIRVFGAALETPGKAALPARRPAYLRPVARRLWMDGLGLPFSVKSPPRVRHARIDALVSQDATAQIDPPALPSAPMNLDGLGVPATTIPVAVSPRPRLRR